MKLQQSATHMDRIRWMLRRDMDQVLQIDQSHVWPRWNESEYLRQLRISNVIGVVIDENFVDVAACMVYTLEPDSFSILKIAVRKDVQRRCLGHALISRLIEKLTQQKRTSIVADVPEWMLDPQLFFRAMGFRGESIRGHIRFVYELKG